MIFEMRLVGSNRIFWSTITPTVCGRLNAIVVPEFCRAADFMGHSRETTHGLWDLWPINNPARPHPLHESDLLCKPVQVTERTPGVALISMQRDDEGDWLWLELFLSDTEPGENGRSVFEDWTEILRSTKDDISKAAVLRLCFNAITEGEIAGFKSQRKLVTTNVGLELRQRTF